MIASDLLLLLELLLPMDELGSVAVAGAAPFEAAAPEAVAPLAVQEAGIALAGFVVDGLAEVSVAFGPS